MIYPPILKPGDKIMIISPASIVKEEYIDGAVSFLRNAGLNPVVSEGAKGPAKGSYASERTTRINDMHKALKDPEVKAILCARGGYGCIHILSEITSNEIRKNPKWLIGFSDVSVLHAAWNRAGVASIHGPMAKHLTLHGADDPYSMALLNILFKGADYDITYKTHSLSLSGYGKGVLRGGNLAVLNSLASTPYDILSIEEDEDVILFIEDIAEAIYEVERMLTRLFLSGSLSRLKGLILGSFTEYKPDKNFQSVEEMISVFLQRTKPGNFPVAFGFPCGHTDTNYPLVEGATVSLEVNNIFTRFKSHQEA